MQAENCAESATTVAPQIAATVNSNAGLPPKKNPMIKQQKPLMAIATDVTTVLPMRSARRPPETHPIAPAPKTKNVETPARRECSPRLAAIITGTHVHIAYNSHI